MLRIYLAICAAAASSAGGVGRRGLQLSAGGAQLPAAGRPPSPANTPARARV